MAEELLNKLSQTPEDGQPSDQVSGQEAGSEVSGGESAGLSDDLLAFIKDQVQQGVDLAVRQAQSKTDKEATRLEQLVEQRMARVESLLDGESLTDQQRAEIKKQVTTQVLLDESAQDVSETKGAASPDGGRLSSAAMAYVRERVTAIQDRAGVELEEDDEEAKMVDFSNPDKFLATFAEAVTAKAERVREEARPPNPAITASALTTGGGGANNIANISDPGELIRMGLSKVRGR